MTEKGSSRSRNQDAIDNIGRNIKKYRDLNDLTLVQLAYLVETDAKQISRLEHGETDPKASTLIRVADALKIEITQLFEKT